MASSSDDLQGSDAAPHVNAIVLMGVSGSGKSTVGDMLAKNLDCSFIDADHFHPRTNIEKMRKGIPLSEEDRLPWLETLSNILRENIVSRKTIILGCSALQKRYRDIIRRADPNYGSRSNGCRVRFVCLEAPMEVIAARLEKRAEEGKHFMPATLLQSQLDLLEIDEAEGIIMIDATLSPHAIVDSIRKEFCSVSVI